MLGPKRSITLTLWALNHNNKAYSLLVKKQQELNKLLEEQLKIERIWPSML